jgi:hypothetical protein
MSEQTMRELREHDDVLPGDNYDRMLAKANLHNAAADLYTALKTWKYAMDTLNIDAWKLAVAMRDAAIAKAEGKK